MMFSASIYSTTTSTTSNKNSTSLSVEEAPTSSTVSSSLISSNNKNNIIHHELFNPSSMALSPFSNPVQEYDHLLYPPNHQKIKKKRNLPGNPDPDAEVIALSPKTLMATNRFVCEICKKGFQRDQNLQLHRRGHNLPWKLKQRNNNNKDGDVQVMKKRVYVCPEPTCVHHHPSRALGDLTGIKKHFCRKHGEKKWKCDKCCKIYAVQSDWKAHSKTCGTREYRCDCGTLFSRKDSFITHRAFCDALAEETARLSAAAAAAAAIPITNNHPSIISSTTQTPFNFQQHSQNLPTSLCSFNPTLNPTWVSTQNHNPSLVRIKPETIFHHHHLLPPFYQEPIPHQSLFRGTTSPCHLSPAHLSATALLQKAATVGAVGDHNGSTMSSLTLTRDFLGLTGDQEVDHHTGQLDGNVNMRGMLSYTGGIEIPSHGSYTTTGSEAWDNC